MIAKGSPEGKIKGRLGDLYLDSNCATLFEKTTDGGTRGWKLIGCVVDASVGAGLAQRNRPQPFEGRLPTSPF